jgi:hypothetical protein
MANRDPAHSGRWRGRADDDQAVHGGGRQEKAQATAADYAKKNCSKNETRQSGTQWVTDMVCAVGAGTMTSHSVTDMASNSVYHTDATSTFDPPTAGHSRTNTIMDGTWLGPCSQE